jgi:hypothetical protein
MLNQGRVLLGAFNDVEQAVAFVERVSTTPGEIVRARWPEARRAFTEAPPIARLPPAPLDERTSRALADILEAPLFARALASKRWRAALVAIDALVVPQPLLNLTRVEALVPRVRKDLTEALFPTTTVLDVTPDTRNASNISFVSSRGELTVSSASLRRLPESGAIEVTFRIEPRPNYVSVLEEGGTLVLRNGHHRVVAARASGLRSIPCVLVAGSIEALAGRMTGALPAAQLRRERPPCIADLAAEGPTSLDVDLRPKQHALRLTTQREVVYQ